MYTRNPLYKKRDGVATMQRTKRGESTIIANLIIFIAVMGMAGATVFVFKSMVDESQGAVVEEKDRTVSVMRTSFVITSAAYVDNSAPNTDTIYVYVKNTGREQFDPDDLDLYIDDLRIPRNATNRTVQVTPDTDTANIGTWDEAEEVEFNIYINYTVPATHTVAVYTPTGVKADSTFSS
jgi:archaellum component FlaG (FlaF/FlaG flagellin family)